MSTIRSVTVSRSCEVFFFPPLQNIEVEWRVHPQRRVCWRERSRTFLLLAVCLLSTRSGGIKQASVPTWGVILSPHMEDVRMEDVLWSKWVPSVCTPNIPQCKTVSVSFTHESSNHGPKCVASVQSWQAALTVTSTKRPVDVAEHRCRGKLQDSLSSFFLGIDWFDSWAFGFDYQSLW